MDIVMSFEIAWCCEVLSTVFAGKLENGSCHLHNGFICTKSLSKESTCVTVMDGNKI